MICGSLKELKEEVFQLQDFCDGKNSSLSSFKLGRQESISRTQFSCYVDNICPLIQGFEVEKR